MSWIPQNDLLAHRDIKAFVSHAGTNSYYESAYHGVPVVAVPLFVDHFSNARKAEYFGIATVLDHQTMNAEELFEAIQLVMNEPRYFQKNIATLVWIPISTLFLSMNKMPALGITFLVVSLAQRTYNYFKTCKFPINS